MKPLRRWQIKALEEYQVWDKPDFLLEATPGAGKTVFAAEICRRFIEEGGERIIWVVPTAALRRQTAQAALDQGGLDLDYEWKGSVFPPPFSGNGFAGVVVTYQSLALASDELFRAACFRAKTLAVLDEIHHASDRLSWGAHLQRAFEPCARRLLMSGTPFRSDQAPISFVTYENGLARAQSVYDYGTALVDKDQVVRSLFFERNGGCMEWEAWGLCETATFEDDLDEQGCTYRLLTALDIQNDHLQGQLRLAHEKLCALRQSDEDAGGLVIAMNCEHARSIAEWMGKSLHVQPALALSDYGDLSERMAEEAEAVIRGFGRGQQPWIVAVRMISEGVDIPRLRVLVYATNYVKSEMPFRQAVGRVVRAEPDHEQPTAYVYLPDDPRLRQYAMKIREQVLASLIEESEEDRQIPLGDARQSSGGLFESRSATHTREGVIAGEDNYSLEEITRAEQVVLRLPLETRRMLDAHTMATVLRVAQGFIPAAEPATEAAPENPAVLLRVRLRRLRTEQHKLAVAIAREEQLGSDEAAYRLVNGQLNREVGIESVRTCFDVEVMVRRGRIARERLKRARARADVHA